MDMQLKQKFIELWKKYFNDAELPITFYYTDEKGPAELVKPGSISRCVIGAVSNIRKGKSYCFNIESIGCFGGKRYLGFTDKIRPNFEYFLSCGIPGELEGERYKKTPELVKELMEKIPKFKAPAKYIVFKRWDMFDVSARPYVPENTLTFSVPMNKFAMMVENMDESFLITESWKMVQKRIVHK